MFGWDGKDGKVLACGKHPRERKRKFWRKEEFVSILRGSPVYTKVLISEVCAFPSTYIQQSRSCAPSFRHNALPHHFRA